ncbi:hypothetical protein EOD39_5815 [Acipenser ruthenus]|uniref:Uncharacterized protein n=1 Tax=Acipenser ruthenus TaxID=7906 RepID=A0A662YZT1_ACIRT|nr:hypothetical protein EOD39_5815 [Acipenser ruthenus]
MMHQPRTRDQPARAPLKLAAMMGLRPGKPTRACHCSEPPVWESRARDRPGPLAGYPKLRQWGEAGGMGKFHGLVPTAIRQQVWLAAPTSLEQALAHAEQVEAVLEEGSRDRAMKRVCGATGEGSARCASEQ